jgi:hypothetical protein
MGTRSQAAFSATLTNYAQGYAQDLASALAEFVAPTVRVAAAVGQYKQYDAKNAFQAYDTSRPVGGTPKRIEFAASDPTYNCLPQALEIGIDDAEREAAGEQQEALEEGKVRTLLSAATISHEDKVVTVMKTLSAVSNRGQWSDTSVDPVGEIDEQIEAIATATGMMPNGVVFGLGAWRVFRNHPKVVAKQPGATIVGVTESQAAALFINPGIAVRVGLLSKDTTKFGGSGSKTNLVGAEVFVLMRSTKPTVYDPGWMKTFTAGEGSVTAVRMYRDERARSDILAIDWSEDIKITASLAAKRLTIT